MPIHEYKKLTIKEKDWTFESLKAEYTKLNAEVKHLKKDNADYYSENKKKDEEIKGLKADKKDMKNVQISLEEEIKMLKKEIAQLQKK